MTNSGYDTKEAKKYRKINNPIKILGILSLAKCEQCRIVSFYWLQQHLLVSRSYIIMK